MELYLLDKDLKFTGIIDTPVSVQWRERYSEVGTFEIHVELDKDLMDLLKESLFVVRKDSEYVGVIEYYDSLDSLEEGRYVTIQGRFAECLLGYRIIRYRMNFNDAKAEPKTVGQIIQAILSDNLLDPKDGNRRMDIFDPIIEDKLSSTSTPVLQVTFEDDMLETIYNLLNEVSSSIRVTMENETETGKNKLKINLFTGVDRSYNQTTNPYVVFSQSFDNLISANYVVDRTEERNTAYIGGEENPKYNDPQGDNPGEGRAMTKYEEVDESGNVLSGVDRKEMFVDGSDLSQKLTDENGKYLDYLDDAEYKETLKSKAKDSIIKRTEKLEGTIDLLTYVYGSGKEADYYIGDILTIDDEIFGSFNKRLIGMDFIDEETSTMEPVFEE